MPHPQPIQGITPHLNVEGASDASAFYQKAFDATELFRMPAEDGKRLMHCHLRINGGDMFLCDTFPEYGHTFQPSNCFTMHLTVDDVDAWWARAVDAGCEIIMPLEVQFWGDRYGSVRDPFQVCWSMSATPTES